MRTSSWPPPASSGRSCWSRDPVLNRAKQIERLRGEEFDVVVIGGGITGAASARDAARRGYRTALVEARDFGEGTSSRSSRLIHGGLRYLEQFEFDLVFEASQERRTLLHIAPHLVRPLEFLFPIYEEGRVGKLKLDAGMWLYDALALFRNIERHQMLDPQQVLAREPRLRTDGLLGGARYFDAQVDDARLVLTTVIGAVEAGAAAANRLEVVQVLVENDRACGVRVRDEGGEEWTIEARVLVNATGPWTDQTLARAGRPATDMVKPSRGTHVHVARRRLPHRSALILESSVDGRIMFVLPWGDLTMIGTTDDYDERPPEEVAPTGRDVAYLIDSANHLFPGAHLTAKEILGAWAGLRPLVVEAGAREDAVSREFVIRQDPPGLLTIAGGKLTSHRSMAEELVDRARDYLKRAFGIEARRKSDTARVPLPGGDFESLDTLCEELRPKASERGLSVATADWLARTHGTLFHEVLDRIDDRPELAEPIVPGRPYVAAEVTFAATAEMAGHVEDVLYRRTHLGLEVGDGFEQACGRVAALMAESLAWSDDQADAERARARGVHRRNTHFRAELDREPEGVG